MTEIRVTEGGKTELGNTDTLYLLTVAEDLHLRLVFEVRQVQLLVCTCSRAVTTLGAGHAVYKPERF